MDVAYWYVPGAYQTREVLFAAYRINTPARIHIHRKISTLLLRPAQHHYSVYFFTFLLLQFLQFTFLLLSDNYLQRRMFS